MSRPFLGSQGQVNLTVAQAAVSPAANVLNGQSWHQAGELGVALLLSAAIGLEREIRQKDAGLRTHTLVGIGAALFMLISKYGFADVQLRNLVVLDPSRMAAQIVSGIGFLGAGLIFVRRDGVRGLTTAASVWVTAAVGSAAGAGLLVLAALTTGMYLVVTLILPIARRHLPLFASGTSTLCVRYRDGQGILRQVLNETTQRGFTIDDLSTAPTDDASASQPAEVAVTLRVRGKPPVSELAGALADLDLVDAVVASDGQGAGD
jgi:putative Mg2+ transporter-C (MgtC) family protein